MCSIHFEMEVILWLICFIQLSENSYTCMVTEYKLLQCSISYKFTNYELSQAIAIHPPPYNNYGEAWSRMSEFKDLEVH